MDIPNRGNELFESINLKIALKNVDAPQKIQLNLN